MLLHFQARRISSQGGPPASPSSQLTAWMPQGAEGELCLLPVVTWMRWAPNHTMRPECGSSPAVTSAYPSEMGGMTAQCRLEDHS